jgi:hypothetical protein
MSPASREFLNLFSPLTTQCPKTLLDYAGQVKDLVLIVATIAGGAGTYFKFFHNRTFKPRLELDVTCQVVSQGDHRYLNAIMQLKNVGLSRVVLDNETTGLLIYWSLPAETGQEDALEVRWSKAFTFVSAFSSHKWIEGGEPINETLLLEVLPAPAKAYKVVLKVTAKEITWKSKTAVVLGTDEVKPAIVAS